MSLVDVTASTLEGLKVPDVAWYSRTRAQAADADQDEVLSTVAPALCVEALSPSNTKREIAEILLAYFEVGVQEVGSAAYGER